MDGKTWDELDREYRAKGWPTIDPRKADYCYQPCENGLHVCGFHPDDVNCLTVATVVTADAASAKVLFEAAKAECASAEGEPDDFIVDLMTDGDCEADFPMARQMLARLQAFGDPA